VRRPWLDVGRGPDQLVASSTESGQRLGQAVGLPLLPAERAFPAVGPAGSELLECDHPGVAGEDLVGDLGRPLHPGLLVLQRSGRTDVERRHAHGGADGCLRHGWGERRRVDGRLETNGSES
jgi:hypothetical protein